MNKFHFLILGNESPDDQILWIKACSEFKHLINFDVVDLTSSDWLEKVTEKKWDYLLAKPPGLTAKFKQIYDERIFILDSVLNMPIYPTPNEIYIYENKRFLYSWLKANNLPCAETKIFYKKAEALDYLTKTDYPIVAKYNIGASGSGVQILKNNSEAVDYVIKTFSSKGAPRRWGPNLQKGNLIKRSLNQLKDLNSLNQKLNKYAAIKQDKQTGFVLFQEFIPHEFEWRIVSIGGSYFAHKKLKLGDKASGSLLKNYDNPPLYLFDFAKSIMDKFNFTSQAIDVFECDKAKLIVNEMQCIFGQSDEYQMLVDAKPGRYVYENNSWQFEEGNFNTNESYDLRVAHIIKLLNKKAE